MNFQDYATQLDTKISQYAKEPDNITAVGASDTTARWNGTNKRYVQAQRIGNTQVAFALHISDPIAHDRFLDDLLTPDLDSTARKIAQFMDKPESEELLEKE